MKESAIAGINRRQALPAQGHFQCFTGRELQGGKAKTQEICHIAETPLGRILQGWRIGKPSERGLGIETGDIIGSLVIGYGLSACSPRKEGDSGPPLKQHIADMGVIMQAVGQILKGISDEIILRIVKTGAGRLVSIPNRHAKNFVGTAIITV